MKSEEFIKERVIVFLFVCLLVYMCFGGGSVCGGGSGETGPNTGY